MEISNETITKPAKKISGWIRDFLRNYLKKIVYLYFLILILVLSAISIKIALAPIWENNQPEFILENVEIGEEALQNAISDINFRDAKFLEIEKEEWSNPFD